MNGPIIINHVPDPSAEDTIKSLRAELAAARDDIAHLEVYRHHHSGHLPTCVGMDESEGRCGCCYLQGEAYRDLKDQLDAAKSGAAIVRSTLGAAREFADKMRIERDAAIARAEKAEAAREIAEANSFRETALLREREAMLRAMDGAVTAWRKIATDAIARAEKAEKECAAALTLADERSAELAVANNARAAAEQAIDAAIERAEADAERYQQKLEAALEDYDEGADMLPVVIRRLLRSYRESDALAHANGHKLEVAEAERDAAIARAAEAESLRKSETERAERYSALLGDLQIKCHDALGSSGGDIVAACKAATARISAAEAKLAKAEAELANARKDIDTWSSKANEWASTHRATAERRAELLREARRYIDPYGQIDQNDRRTLINRIDAALAQEKQP